MSQMVQNTTKFNWFSVTRNCLCPFDWPQNCWTW